MPSWDEWGALARALDDYDAIEHRAATEHGPATMTAEEGARRIRRLATVARSLYAVHCVEVMRMRPFQTWRMRSPLPMLFLLIAVNAAASAVACASTHSLGWTLFCVAMTLFCVAGAFVSLRVLGRGLL